MATATARAERRLVALMAADIVGYSKLVEQDEAATLAAIRALRREVIDPLLAEHYGRIVKLMGDGAIVEFGSVVDAVACAVAVQKALAKQQAEVAPERRLVFRIGVNLGDVVVEGDDLLGDGVNIAARLEQLCDPGGVLISGTAYDHLKGKLELALEPRGEQRLKNIAEPVRAYRVRLDGKPARRGLSLLRARHFALPAMAALLLALALAGAAWWLWPGGPAGSGKPSIAVLPFDNLSADPEQGYLADGIAEDIITQLARNRELKVIARTTSFSFRGQGKTAQQLAEALGGAYVLEGSVRRMGDELRVAAQLIDGSSGEHLWAENFNRPAKDIVQVQDAIVEGIAGQLFSEIRQSRKATVLNQPVDDLTTYALTVKALALKHTYDPANYREARRILREVLEKEPDYARAHAVLGYLNFVDISMGVTGELGAADLDAAIAELREAARLDPNSALAYQALGQALSLKPDLPGALDAARRSVALGPSDADNYILLASTESLAGEFEAAAVSGEIAFELNPNPPIWYYDPKGLYLFGLGRYEEMAETMRHCVQQMPDLPFCRGLLAVAEVALGRLEDARRTVAALKRSNPIFTLRSAELNWPFPEAPKKRDELLDNLRSAGLT